MPDPKDPTPVKVRERGGKFEVVAADGSVMETRGTLEAANALRDRVNATWRRAKADRRAKGSPEITREARVEELGELFQGILAESLLDRLHPRTPKKRLEHALAELECDALEELEEVALPYLGKRSLAKFDPRLHPRSRTGEFREALGKLQKAPHGSRVALPHGVFVRRGAGGLEVWGAGQKHANFSSTAAAAAEALYRHDRQEIVRGASPSVHHKHLQAELGSAMQATRSRRERQHLARRQQELGREAPYAGRERKVSGAAERASQRPSEQHERAARALRRGGDEHHRSALFRLERGDQAGAKRALEDKGDDVSRQALKHLGRIDDPAGDSSIPAKTREFIEAEKKRVSDELNKVKIRREGLRGRFKQFTTFAHHLSEDEELPAWARWGTKVGIMLAIVPVIPGDEIIIPAIVGALMVSPRTRKKVRALWSDARYGDPPDIDTPTAEKIERVLKRSFENAKKQALAPGEPLPMLAGLLGLEPALAEAELEEAWRDLLHPRIPKGRRGGGQFRDVLDRLEQEAQPRGTYRSPGGLLVDNRGLQARGRKSPGTGPVAELAAKLKPGGSKKMGDLPDGTVFGTPDGRVGVLMPSEGKPTYGDKTYVVAYDLATGQRFEPPAWLPPTTVSTDAKVKAAAAKMLQAPKKTHVAAPELPHTVVPEAKPPPPLKPVEPPKMAKAELEPAAKAAAAVGVDLKEAFAPGDASPANPDRAELRARAASAIYEADAGVEDAVLSLVGDTPGRQERIEEIAHGDVGRALKEYAMTPLGDLEVLGGIDVADHPVWGQASCNLVTRKLSMGSTSAMGDFRHELGHAIRSAMGGSSPGNHTPLTAQVAELHQETLQKRAENADKIPPSFGPPSVESNALKQSWYEENYGAVDPRQFDSWEEDAAEQYRAYHKAVYQQTQENKADALAHYRKVFPGWARIWDAWYSAQLGGQPA